VFGGIDNPQFACYIRAAPLALRKWTGD